MKIPFFRSIGTAVTALTLTGAAAAATITVGTTGPLSHNQTAINNTSSAMVSDVSNVLASNGLFQVATSGNSGVSLTTNGGSASAGSAMNTSTTSTNVSVTSGSGSGAVGSASDSISLDTTGPGSFNSAVITNNNSWSRSNFTSVTVSGCTKRQCGQTATSGDASSSLDTNGGSATSGAASNDNNSSTSVNISN